MKKPRKLIGERQEKVCEECKTAYSPFPYKNETSRFCCKACYLEFHKQKVQTCQQCNSTFKRDRVAKYCSRECSSKNNRPLPIMKKTGEYHPGIRTRMENLGLTWEEYNNWRVDKARYRREVWRITNQQDLALLDNYDKPRTRAGILGGFQLDHKISIEEGWNSKIDPNVIGSISNLQFITWECNLKKR